MNCANQTGKTHIHSSSVYNTEERHNNNSNPQQLFRKKLRSAEKLSKQLYIKHRQDETHVHGTKTSQKAETQKHSSRLNSKHMIFMPKHALPAQENPPTSVSFPQQQTQTYSSLSHSRLHLTH